MAKRKTDAEAFSAFDRDGDGRPGGSLPKGATKESKMAKKATSSKAGPPSSLKTHEGSPTGASAGGNTSNDKTTKGLAYDVQIHTDEKGLEVFRVNAESGDEAAQKALEKKNYRGASVRGVTPASDPDPNSLGGERDASIMISNAENPDGGVDPLGTEANREATEKLGKADVSELGE